MFTMRSLAMKLFRAAWAHVSTSIRIIAISICLVMTMSLYIWNAHAQMKEEIHARFGYADVTVGYTLYQEKSLSAKFPRTDPILARNRHGVACFLDPHESRPYE